MKTLKLYTFLKDFVKILEKLIDLEDFIQHLF